MIASHKIRHQYQQIEKHPHVNLKRNFIWVCLRQFWNDSTEITLARSFESLSAIVDKCSEDLISAIGANSASEITPESLILVFLTTMSLQISAPYYYFELNPEENVSSGGLRLRTKN